MKRKKRNNRKREREGKSERVKVEKKRLSFTRILQILY